MSDTTFSLTEAIGQLSDRESLSGLFHEHRDGYPLPSGAALEEIVQLSRSILFPGYYGKSSVDMHTLKYRIGVSVERLDELLTRQILAGLCFTLADKAMDLASAKTTSRLISRKLIARLPEIRRMLATDVEAAYQGDPAATSHAEVISCYPVIRALSCYRLAHELAIMGVPLIPRMMTEQAHSETGIDIHPKAQIGEYFTIDHGTGVVIGATAVIGRHVKLYQGVTLGAKSFPLDDDGNPIKGIPRHPILEDDVIVYANATILGRVTIGRGCVVGASAWVMEDMAPGTKAQNE